MLGNVVNSIDWLQFRKVINNSPTVSQYLKQHGISGKVWLCPNAVSNGRIGNPDYLTGVECTVSSIPSEVKDKHVWNHFREGGFECIVWYNEEDYSYTV